MRLALFLTLAFALCAFLAACALEPEPQSKRELQFAPAPPTDCRTFTVLPGFTADKRARLDSAVYKWNRVAKHPFCLKDGEAETSRIREVAFESDEYKAISASFNGYQIYGVYYPDKDEVVLMSNIVDDFFEAVAMHELGHSIGLAHIEAPGIMFGGGGSPIPQFTDADMAECIRVGACNRPPSQLN